MRISRIPACFAVLVAGSLLRASADAATFADLVRRVPGDANAIMMINAEALFASPIAERNGWKKRRQVSFAERPFSIPIQATKVVRAGQVDLQSRDILWEVAIIDAPHIPSIESIAQREKGYVDQVANRPAAWSPRGAYAVLMVESALGLCFPPNRQFLARWIKEPSGRISPRLLKASESMAATDSQLMMAIDLEDAVEPARLEQSLQDLKYLKTAGIAPSEAARLIASVRGIKFEMIFNDKSWGRLQLEFGADPAPLVPVAGQLVAEGLRRLGVALDGIEDWKVSHNGQTITLSGVLSEAGIMRLSSVFELPSLDAEEEESTGVDKAVLYATQTHFKSVNRLLDDLLGEKRDAVTMGQLALWVEQYAKRIDRLPLVNVDPDLQDYSAGVAEDLRQIASALKGAGVRTGVRNANTYNSGSYGWGNYDGYYGNRAVSNERRAARAQERGQGTMTTMQIADQIRNDTSRVRRQMTERYHAEF